MALTAQQLIVGRAAPVTASSEETLQVALDRMVEHDFSQLPVVDAGNRPNGLVSSDSIVRALSNFRASLNDLHVKDAIDPVRPLLLDDDLLEVLDKLRDAYAVLIVDSERRLVGIVTSYDTTTYFRRRAEDSMVVEDIETMLKDLILHSFGVTNPADGNKQLTAAIEELTPSNQRLRKRFFVALTQYVLEASDSQPINKALAETVFTRHMDHKPPTRAFEEMTFYDYAELLLHAGPWATYSSDFAVDREILRSLLNGVRETRNVLMHFKREITPSERQQLRFCRNWFDRHQPPKTLLEQVTADLPSPDDTPTAPNEPAPDDEELRASDSRYAPLALHLRRQLAGTDAAGLTFAQIEGILGTKLPPTAYRHRSWWANDYISHVQSREWLDAGWRVSAVDTSAEQVVFSRVKEREVGYKAFFDALLADLKRSDPSWILPVASHGRNWLAVGNVPEGSSSLAYFAFSFAHHRRFRAELYIGGSDRERSKRIFDTLYAKRVEIENDVDESLAWERLDRRTASRIALYRSGAIDDSQADLDDVKTWAVAAMRRLRTTLKRHVVEGMGA